MYGIRIVRVCRSAEEFRRIDSQTHVPLQQKVGDGSRKPFHVLFVGFCDRLALGRCDNHITHFKEGLYTIRDTHRFSGSIAAG